MPRVQPSVKNLFDECYCLPRIWLSAKDIFAECFIVPKVALGKSSLCRVPVFLLLAK